MAQAIQFAILGLGAGAAYTLLAQGISGGPNGGMGFVTEERSVFMSLTTEENLRIAGVAPAAATDVFPELAPLMKRTAGLLSGGEQHLRQALHIADRVSVMQRGRIVISGTADEVDGRIDEIEATYLSDQRTGGN